MLYRIDILEFLVFLHDLRTLSKHGELSNGIFVEQIVIDAGFIQGKSISNALHTPSNYQDRDYQRFIRIFSLQLRKQPIEIKIKEMFTVNYALLKSVRRLCTISLAIFNGFFFPSQSLSCLEWIIFMFHFYLRLFAFQGIVLITTYVAIVIQFQISDENIPPHLKMGKQAN